MVEVNYRGTLGNNMFQYAFGRILSEELGFTFNPEHPLHGEYVRPAIGPTEGFINTLTNPEGLEYTTPIQLTCEPGGHVSDNTFQSILNDTSPRKIYVDGYPYRYNFYKPYKDKIRNWYHITEAPPMVLGQNDLVLTVRRGWNNYPTNDCLPFSYFETLLSQINFDRLIICTDSFEDPFFENFKSYNPIYANYPIFQQFNLIRSANKIVMTESTYCWWAGFLSEAQEVYFPLQGGWLNDPLVDLEVKDEPRFINVNELGEIIQQIKEEIII